MRPKKKLRPTRTLAGLMARMKKAGIAKPAKEYRREAAGDKD